jgi:hypothetical protein
MACTTQEKDVKEMEEQRRQKNIDLFERVLVDQGRAQRDGHKHEARQGRRSRTAHVEKVPPLIDRHNLLSFPGRRSSSDGNNITCGFAWREPRRSHQARL